MKKSLQFFFTVCFAVLLLASCGEEELSIDDSKEVSETVTSASKAVENGDLDLMLIQDESVIFPQSQGVYDFHENELTIVKQYLPMADLEDSSASASDVALYEGQIESDFQRHFSHSEVQLSNDPYQIYETTYQDASYIVEGKRLTIMADGRTFEFTLDPNNQKAYDQNGVSYDIQVDQ